MSRSTKSARIGEKIEHLVHEGKPKKQAIAMAINMEKKHRLGAHGEYWAKGKK